MRRLLPLAVALATAGSGAQAQWTQTAGPEGGYVRSIATDGENIYAEFWNNWFYHHDGSSWIKGTNSIANQLFVAGPALLGNSPVADVVRSTDKGQTWEPLAGSAPNIILTVDAGTAYGSRNDTILVSEDGGASWSIAGIPPVDGAMVDALGAHGDTLIAGSISVARSFRSTDGGEHWAPVRIDSAGQFSPAAFIHSGSTFYARFHTQGVYRSDDGGATWQGVNQGLPRNADNYPYITSMAVAGNALLASTVTETFRYDGTVWSKMDAGYLENGRFAGEGNSLYCGSNAGVFRSTDLGLTWTPMNSGLIATYVSSFASSGNALLCNSWNGIHRTTDGGATWNKVSPITAEQLASAGSVIYARAQNYTGLGIHRSEDAGLTWTAANGGIGESLYHMTSMAVAGQKLVVGFYDITNFHGSTRWQHGGIARSSDGGRSWSAGNTGLPVEDNTPVPVIDIATSGSTFVASTIRGVYRSTDGGASWSRSQTGLPAQTPYRGVLAHVEGNYYIAVERTVYRSDDEGVTWSPYGEGLDSTVTVESFSVAGSRIFAHVYSSEQQSRRAYILMGDRWMDLNGTEPIFSGPEAIPGDVTFTAITKFGTAYYAGSSARGVWKHPGISDTVITLGVDDWRNGPASLLREASPNPFSSATTIRFHLPARAHVRLSVADATGREVALLREEVMDAGEATLGFGADALPSGAYFIRLMTDGRIQTLPVVLAR